MMGSDARAEESPLFWSFEWVARATVFTAEGEIWRREEKRDGEKTHGRMQGRMDRTGSDDDAEKNPKEGQRLVRELRTSE